MALCLATLLARAHLLTLPLHHRLAHMDSLVTSSIYLSATHTLGGLASSADALKVNTKVCNFDLYRFGGCFKVKTVVNHFPRPLQEVPRNFFTLISFFLNHSWGLGMIRKSEDNLRELVISVFHEGPMEQTQVFGLGGQVPLLIEPFHRHRPTQFLNLSDYFYQLPI